jgi:hypothetical protein
VTAGATTTTVMPATTTTYTTGYRMVGSRMGIMARLRARR